MNQKKLKPGLVASYDLRPGNGEGLFWFRYFIGLSLTYLDTYPLTAPGPTCGDLKQTAEWHKPTTWGNNMTTLVEVMRGASAMVFLVKDELSAVHHIV